MRLALYAFIVLALAAPAAAALSTNPFQSKDVSRWHLALAPHTQFVGLRQIGSPYSTPNDTRLVTLIDGLGHLQTTHSAAWKFIELPKSVPANAKAVKLSFRLAITRGRGGDSDYAIINAYARSVGATCCAGPPGFRNYPVDFSLQGRALDGSDSNRSGIVAQGEATGPSGSYRGWSTIDLPVHKHGFQFGWEYRKASGSWPVGDAVGISIYVDGWAN